jgi:hypothetical protein
MKGIVGELGEMKIPLNPYSKPVTQRWYRMNIVYKQKVKEKIEDIGYNSFCVEILSP